MVVISRNRAGKTLTQNVLPKWAKFLVPESQADAYRQHLDNEIITCPDDTLGIGKTKNYVLDHVDSRMVCIFDDDVKAIRYIGGNKRRKLTPTEVAYVICNLAQMTDDLGLHTFSFTMKNGMTYDPHKPFSLCATYSGFTGVIDRKYHFPDLKLKTDVDYVLQNLLYDRIVFFDCRYAIETYIDSNTGGASLFRSDEKIKEERAVLCKKWGKYLKYKQTRALKCQESRMVIVPTLNVRRTQHLDI